MRTALLWTCIAALITAGAAGASDTHDIQPQKNQSAPPTTAPLPEREPIATPSGLQPFGANLFTGNFIKTRQTGVNPDYVIMPGDKVAVYAWGAIEINNVFTVDSQGNIFLPEIGPVHLEGVTNARLTKTVEKAIRQVYVRNFGVYTNLLTANPIAVFVTGGVVNPGRYAGLPSDSVLYFLDQAGGIQPNLGSYRSVLVLRDGKEIAHIDLYGFLLRGQLPLLQFQDNDTILVDHKGTSIALKGDVAQPCLLEFPDENPTGAQALEVIPTSAEATAVTVRGVRQERPFSRTLQLGEFASFRLRDGDTVILRKEGQADTITVYVEGEHLGPSVLTARRGTRLVDLLNHIPVDPKLADVSAIHLKRVSVAKAQKDAISDALFRLERSALLALSHSRGESDIRVKEAELTAKFVERARQIQPLGRVVTAVDGTQLNVLLEDRDTIVIPPKTNVVRIGGEVMMAQAVIHRPGLRARDYIAMAGGYSERGNDDQVIIMHADASVTLARPNAVVAPGDEILVPPMIDVKVLQNATDVMQIIYQVAMSAGVVLAL